MLNRGLFVGFLLLGSGVLSLAYAENSPLPAITENNHSVLASYWSEQAKEMREKAKRFDEIAEAYEKSQKPGDKPSNALHAAHCRGIADNYRHSASGAEVLADSHRAQLP